MRCIYYKYFKYKKNTIDQVTNTTWNQNTRHIKSKKKKQLQNINFYTTNISHLCHHQNRLSTINIYFFFSFIKPQQFPSSTSPLILASSQNFLPHFQWQEQESQTALHHHYQTTWSAAKIKRGCSRSPTLVESWRNPSLQTPRSPRKLKRLCRNVCRSS